MGAVSWDQVAELLWHAVGTKAMAKSGRAGIPIEWRVCPSAGGLHPIHIICIPQTATEGIRLYDPNSHAFDFLAVSENKVIETQNEFLMSVIGSVTGCTLLFVADVKKIDAAYEHGMTLTWRNAGAIISTLCLCAEWLGLGACPLGFNGDRILAELPYPLERFTGMGGVFITS
ncbi:hypothetical protein AZA_09502 [Nitrospirillum viridazoti Y2]|nr:nitroreductase family protein [Nitrospirillum amazonense]EGY00580.1 hypothetical protein AZA_09502 [Nitrospirillum amazonense Y2]